MDKSDSGSSSEEELYDALSRGQKQSSPPSSPLIRISTTSTQHTFRKTSIRQFPPSNPVMVASVHPIESISSLDASKTIDLMRSNTTAALGDRDDRTRQVNNGGFSGPPSALIINNVETADPPLDMVCKTILRTIFNRTCSNFSLL